MEQARRYSQNEIAAAIGISVGMVSYLMNGKRRPSWALAKRLAERFGRSPAWWMEASAARISRALRNGRNGKAEGSDGGQKRAA